MTPSSEAAGDTPKADTPEDRFLWLEEVGGDAPLAWARARNAECAQALTTPESAAVEKRVLAFLDSDVRIPDIGKLGAWYYNFWKDAQNPRGVWRRTSLAEYRKAQPAWETVLDLDALAAAENENWVWQGAECFRPACTRCLLSLSRGGADAHVVREFDLATKSFATDGFTLPEAKSSTAWIDADTIYVGTDFGPGSMTASGYTRIVKVWPRGMPLAQATTVFEGRHEDIWVYAYRELAKGFERDVIVRGTTFFTNEAYVRHAGEIVRVDKPDSAEMHVHRDLMLVQLRDDWTVGGTTYRAGSLLAANLDRFLQGDRHLAVLFEPNGRKSLAGYSPTRHHILLNELDNVKNRVWVLTHKQGTWQRAPLPGMPVIGTVTAWAVDSDASDDYFASVSDNVTPTALLHGTIGRGAPETLKQLPAIFDATGLAVTQHEVLSKDGTRIPYFQVARANLVLDGSNPTVLTGYGGFEIPLLPSYSGSIGAAWLEKGGVYVIANIRGGGEFGPEWHKAALKANRPRAYEDFIAVAEDLSRRKVTSPAHLGISGGSNGGLLVGNMLTMRPDLFGAVVCQVPLLDMRRFHLLLAGASWVAEYGNPDDPDEWAFIRTFSPYHNLKDGVRYPPTLFMTSTRDDRVHPGHARKMAARMLAAGQDVLYYENIEGGHGGAADNRQLAHMTALAYEFFRQKLL
jgi:prolyl oligopeptidase